MPHGSELVNNRSSEYGNQHDRNERDRYRRRKEFQFHVPRQSDRKGSSNGTGNGNRHDSREFSPLRSPLRPNQPQYEKDGENRDRRNRRWAREQRYGVDNDGKEAPRSKRQVNAQSRPLQKSDSNISAVIGGRQDVVEEKQALPERARLTMRQNSSSSTGNTSWGDMVEEAEEKEEEMKKGLTSYKEFIENMNYETTGPKKELEENIEILLRRQKQLEYGKNNLVYRNYVTALPKHMRESGHPKTPNKFLKMSRRRWDGQVQVWRRVLHNWSGENEAISSVGDDFEIISNNSEASDRSSFADVTPATPPSSPFGSVIAASSATTVTHASPIAGTLPQSELTSDILTMALSEFGSDSRIPAAQKGMSFQGRIQEAAAGSGNTQDLYDFVLLQGSSDHTAEEDACAASNRDASEKFWEGFNLDEALACDDDDFLHL
ncbi:PREDICTED: uncharacterized protein LOC106809626 isoform X2 [Priapulus caudatus]|uniref:Uncharacterized protein LOC106809626 isoform X2 n=1 Tax=Priapulus caudatus TaxID=37621 RepID=A0ABM1E7U6_PRICU|nr:PREDICTED: uncharacterized protein LOC106809626 isoform X2 [Priapulus caudatus]